MGRPEKAVDRTVPARAKLADFLRDRKSAAGLTYEEMAKFSQTKGAPSKATLERAASGVTVPSMETVEAFITVTTTEEEEFAGNLADSLNHGLELWIRARRATRAPYYVHKAPDPELISTVSDLSRYLRHQHVWAGCPTPGEMQRMSGPGLLPISTARRIINGDTLPVDAHQAIAFLSACYVRRASDLVPWLAAAIRALTHSRRDTGPWAKEFDILKLHAFREDHPVRPNPGLFRPNPGLAPSRPASPLIRLAA
ncbi:helix-turn-helix domain-containing protein [Streptomyces asoensis]|uniref:helix-turn-helix domain-containing protein n=1 Tax=Streptomyces asoensis TaxID=249586 RepID=UPI00340AA326